MSDNVQDNVNQGKNKTGNRKNKDRFFYHKKKKKAQIKKAQENDESRKEKPANQIAMGISKLKGWHL